MRPDSASRSCQFTIKASAFAPTPVPFTPPRTRPRRGPKQPVPTDRGRTLNHPIARHGAGARVQGAFPNPRSPLPARSVRLRLSRERGCHLVGFKIYLPPPAIDVLSTNLKLLDPERRAVQRHRQRRYRSGLFSGCQYERSHDRGSPRLHADIQDAAYGVLKHGQRSGDLGAMLPDVDGDGVLAVQNESTRVRPGPGFPLARDSRDPPSPNAGKRSHDRELPGSFKVLILGPNLHLPHRPRGDRPGLIDSDDRCVGRHPVRRHVAGHGPIMKAGDRPFRFPDGQDVAGESHLERTSTW